MFDIGFISWLSVLMHESHKLKQVTLFRYQTNASIDDILWCIMHYKQAELICMWAYL